MNIDTPVIILPPLHKPVSPFARPAPSRRSLLMACLLGLAPVCSVQAGPAEIRAANEVKGKVANSDAKLNEVLKATRNNSQTVDASWITRQKGALAQARSELEAIAALEQKKNAEGKAQGIDWKKDERTKVLQEINAAGIELDRLAAAFEAMQQPNAKLKDLRAKATGPASGRSTLTESQGKEVSAVVSRFEEMGSPRQETKPVKPVKQDSRPVLAKKTVDLGPVLQEVEAARSEGRRVMMTAMQQPSRGELSAEFLKQLAQAREKVLAAQYKLRGLQAQKGLRGKDAEALNQAFTSLESTSFLLQVFDQRFQVAGAVHGFRTALDGLKDSLKADRPLVSRIASAADKVAEAQKSASEVLDEARSFVEKSGQANKKDPNFQVILAGMGEFDAMKEEVNLLSFRAEICLAPASGQPFSSADREAALQTIENAEQFLGSSTFKKVTAKQKEQWANKIREEIGALQGDLTSPKTAVLEETQAQTELPAGEEAPGAPRPPMTEASGQPAESPTEPKATGVEEPKQPAEAAAQQWAPLFPERETETLQVPELKEHPLEAEKDTTTLQEATAVASDASEAMELLWKDNPAKNASEVAKKAGAAAAEARKAFDKAHFGLNAALEAGLVSKADLVNMKLLQQNLMKLMILEQRAGLMVADRSGSMEDVTTAAGRAEAALADLRIINKIQVGRERGRSRQNLEDQINELQRMVEARLPQEEKPQTGAVKGPMPEMTVTPPAEGA